MKKILYIIVLVFISASVFGQQIGFLKSRIIRVMGQDVYIVSLADLKLPKKTVAVNYYGIVNYAKSAGYDLCSENLVTQIYNTFTDGLKGKDWTADRWLTVCTPEGNTYTIGKGSGGKFMENSSKDTWHVFWSYDHACIALIKK